MDGVSADNPSGSLTLIQDEPCVIFYKDVDNVIILKGKEGDVNNSIALSDGAAVTVTGPKHTWTSNQATVTVTLSQTSDYSTIILTLNAITTTHTYPAGAHCISNGAASGDNTLTLNGTSGNTYAISIYKDGTDYTVIAKNRDE
jgi:hypothetical protein